MARNGTRKNTEIEERISQNDRLRASSDHRKNKNKKKNRLTALLTVITICVLTFIVGSVTVFYIESVDVVGNESGAYSDEQIVTAANLTSAKSMLLLQPDKIAGKIRQTLPYIGDVTVKRKLPGKVLLYVEYVTPAFAVSQGNNWVLLDSTGKVLEIATAVPSKTAILEGIFVVKADAGNTAEFDQPDAFEDAKKIYESYSEYGIENVTQLNTLNAGSITMVIGNKLYVHGHALSITVAKMNVIALLAAEYEAKTGSYTFTVAADGSITVGVIKEKAEPIVITDDSELVPADDELISEEEYEYEENPADEYDEADIEIEIEIENEDFVG